MRGEERRRHGIWRAHRAAAVGVAVLSLSLHTESRPASRTIERIQQRTARAAAARRGVCARGAAAAACGAGAVRGEERMARRGDGGGCGWFLPSCTGTTGTQHETQGATTPPTHWRRARQDRRRREGEERQEGGGGEAGGRGRRGGWHRSFVHRRRPSIKTGRHHPPPPTITDRPTGRARQTQQKKRNTARGMCHA